MFNLISWVLGGWLLLVSFGVSADETEEALSADFLHYLTEFSDEQGDILDPEALAELMRVDQSAEHQESLKSSIASDMADDEVKL